MGKYPETKEIKSKLPTLLKEIKKEHKHSIILNLIEKVRRKVIDKRNSGLFVL